MICIENINIVLENGILWDGILMIQDDRIAAFGKRGTLKIPSDVPRLDGNGAYLGPGFVDIHAHGGGGHLFWQDPESAADFFLRRGTTSVFPALYQTIDKQTLLIAMDRIQTAMESQSSGRIIRGIYMEGPYMNPNYGSSKNANKWFASIRQEDYKPVVDRAGTLATLWAIAPEREGVEDFVRYVKSVNPSALFSVGHSQADPSQIRKFKKYGLNHQTHCLNATGQVSHWLGVRGSGPDEACFLDGDMYAELICDSGAVHVNPEMQQLILKNKGLDRVVLISDNSGRPRNAPEGLSHLTDLSFDDQGNLGGSLLSLDMACRNLMTHTNCGIAQAFLLAARNPARAMGMDDEIGTVQVGKRADLVLVDHKFQVQTVILAGKILSF